MHPIRGSHFQQRNNLISVEVSSIAFNRKCQYRLLFPKENTACDLLYKRLVFFEPRRWADQQKVRSIREDLQMSLGLIFKHTLKISIIFDDGFLQGIKGREKLTESVDSRSNRQAV